MEHLQLELQQERQKRLQAERENSVLQGRVEMLMTMLNELEEDVEAEQMDDSQVINMWALIHEAYVNSMFNIYSFWTYTKSEFKFIICKICVFICYKLDLRIKPLICQGFYCIWHVYVVSNVNFLMTIHYGLLELGP